MGTTLLQHFLEGLSGVLDMLAQQVASGGDIAFPAQLQNLLMFLVGAFHSVGQIQLQARIALASVVHITDDGHKARLIAAGIEGGVKLPVQPAPARDVILPIQVTHVAAQNCFCLRQVFFGEMRNRLLEHLGFEQGANREEFLNVFGRKSGHNCSPIGNNGN